MFLEEIVKVEEKVVQSDTQYLWPVLLISLAIIGGIALLIYIYVRDEWYPLEPMNDKEFRKCYNIPEPVEKKGKKKKRK